MNELFNVSTSPHVRQKISTRRIMLDVIIALIPTTIFGIWQFGPHALLIVIATVAASILAEWLFCKITKRPQTISDLSCIVTGLILALNMPPQIPIWMPIVGAFFAIIVAKELFGGLGQNFMNPALAARCFMLISFASAMTTFSTDAVSSATPLYILRESESLEAVTSIEAFKSGMGVSPVTSFLGFIGGCIGEISKPCLILGALYLLVRKVISPKIPLIYILSYAIFTFMFGKYPGNMHYLLIEIFSGGLIFGAFFMATDYATSPITPLGQILFAVFLGLITFILRTFGASAEGVSYAIILGNILVPFLDKFTMPKAFGREGK